MGRRGPVGRPRFPGCGSGGRHSAELWCCFFGVLTGPLNPEFSLETVPLLLVRLGRACTGQSLGHPPLSRVCLRRDASSEPLSYHHLYLQKLLSVPPITWSGPPLSLYLLAGLLPDPDTAVWGIFLKCKWDFIVSLFSGFPACSE